MLSFCVHCVTFREHFLNMASTKVQATFAALQEVLAVFHTACEGDMGDVAALFKAMSGQSLPPQVLIQILGIPPEVVAAASEAGEPVRATKSVPFSSGLVGGAVA